MYWYFDQNNRSNVDLTAVLSNDVFTDYEIDIITSYCDNISPEKAEVKASEHSTESKDLYTPSIRRSEIVWLDHNNHTQLQFVFDKLTNAVQYVNNQAFKYSLVGWSGLQYTLYHSDDSGVYDWHTDDSMFYNSKEYTKRKLSFTMLLSDPSNYSGGNFEIMNGSTPEAYQLKKGSIIFFPSFTLHRVTQVTRGTRKSLVGWVEGPNWV